MKKLLGALAALLMILALAGAYKLTHLHFQGESR